MKNFKNRHEKVTCNVADLKAKSLKKRIRGMVNIGIILTIILMMSSAVFLTKAGLDIVKTNVVDYYANRIQGIVDQHEITDESVEDLRRNRELIKEIDQLSKLTPILSLQVTVEDKVVYVSNPDNFLLFIMELNDEKSEIALEEVEEEFRNPPKFDEAIEFSKTQKIQELNCSMGNHIGYITVGLDTDFEYGIYFLITITSILLVFLVYIIMRVVMSIMTKPILNPLYKLRDQIEELADDKHDDINPTVISDPKTVREIRDLSDSTNKLIDKMIRYNEVITQSEKMASVGQLTAAITHEINTPLGVINSNAGMMKLLTQEAINARDQEEKAMLLETINESADTTEEACYRIQDIIKSLRSYSRIDQADFVPASINESMKSVVILTTNLHKNRIVIHEEFGDIPDASCFIGLINQVFMNLIINAIQAIEGEGNITLRTTSDDTYIYASVIDDGCGISSKDIYRVFEYGFTTKQPGSGSGIGLALSKNIIDKHKGEIIVKSNLGEGSEITVKLPINSTHDKNA